MNIENYIQKMDKEWDEEGFLHNLRSGLFSQVQAEKFSQLLQELDLRDNDSIPKRLLTLMWFLPLFLEWQRERVSEVNRDNASLYSRFIDDTHNTLQKNLGVP